MRDRLVYILFIVGILLAITVLGILVWIRFSSGGQSISTTPTPTPMTATPTPLIIPFNKPTTPTLTIGTVTTKNFYTQGTIIDTNGDVSIQKTKGYELVYLAPFQEFIIDVTAAPFATVRTQAEQEFLQELGITQQQACALKVSVGVRASSDPQQAGKRMGLSFCENQ